MADSEMSTDDFLAPLIRIGDGIHLYEPPPPLSDDDPDADPDGQGPRLIVMCTWLGGASAKNIGHYVAGHRRLFRRAALLLVTTRLCEITVTPFRQMHERLRPARDVILRHVLDGVAASQSSASASFLSLPPPPSILWHIFSNGGLNTAIQLARITRQKLLLTTGATTATAIHRARNSLASPSPAALDAALGGVIMDCCPGDASLGRTFHAAAHSLPKTWASQTVGRLLLLPAVAALLCAQAAGSRLLGRGGSIGDLWRGAHDPSLLGGEAVARLYLYSVSDRLVPWRLVHRHMEEARDRGFADVRGEAIPGGGHCALLKGDADRYWRAVEGFWRDNSSGRRRWRTEEEEVERRRRRRLFTGDDREELPLEEEGEEGDCGINGQKKDEMQIEQVPGLFMRSRL